MCSCTLVGESPHRYMAMFGPDEIAHNSTLILADPPMWLFGILQSAMFDAWLRSMCGRLKSDIRIEADMAYNAFPFHPRSDNKEGVVAQAMTAVLAARSAHIGSSLADLYGALSMPAALANAHDDLDRAVDSLYAPRKRLNNDADRLAVLLERYQTLTAAPGTTAAT